MESILTKGIPRMCAECSSFVYHNMLCTENNKYIDRNTFLHERDSECPIGKPIKRRELAPEINADILEKAVQNTVTMLADAIEIVE
jgi:hypothetical protein